MADRKYASQLRIILTYLKIEYNRLIYFSIMNSRSCKRVPPINKIFNELILSQIYYRYYFKDKIIIGLSKKMVKIQIFYFFIRCF